MEAAVFKREAEAQATHWWFVGRRKLVERMLNRLRIGPEHWVLDVGSGTGTNLRLLAARGHRNYLGVEPSQLVIGLCRQHGLGPAICAGAYPLPFADATFDLVMLTDVLEHLDDDARALSEAKRVLKPGAHLLITVPASPALWGAHDVASHHRRRYVMAGLRDLIARAGFEIVEDYHFNFILFPLIWLARRLIDLFKIELESETAVNTPLINRILGWVFALDLWAAPWARVPFGVSIFCLCRKP